MTSRYARTALVLGLLSAIGPFAIDMYIPALPTIASDLHASTAATQMTLMAFFIAFGVCQILYGPISDMIGRKRPLYAGLAFFTLGSVGCIFARNIEMLILFRFVQGIGAASVMVIPRAIIRDLHTGIEATRLMSLVMLVISVSPILAPLAGSALIVPFGWRAVFVAVTGAALVSLILLMFSLPETRPPEDRIKVSAGEVLSGFGQLFRDRHFLGLTFIGGLGMSSFFAFLASSSFIYIDHFGLTPTEYSITFSLNAVGFIGASQLTASLGSRYGMARVVTAAVSLYAFFALLLLGVTLAGVDSLVALIALLFCSFAFLGLVIPSTMVLALEDHGPIAGIASALGGTLQMVTGGVMIVIVSLLYDGTTLPMVGAIAACSVGALTLSLLTLRRRQPISEPLEQAC
ncbi:multidrug effflux MFS transporter [Microvirga puerhi]|uniref:Bcr/CflA family efflux transporter n=1 Tax=Microvirga puerhi TaxID=2876078 RepID=A0ABS7VLQ6_9HYPH|nr:multidrug effflux MFS transporter [Microvirga puerhi]MBZ6076075.1 multidrug effflux MFS transporter [Microvirga puerhi]